MRIKSPNTVNAGITETYVILSGVRSAQSKDLSGDETVLLGEGRRSFDSLRSLRMTNPYVLRLFVTFQTLIRIVHCQLSIQKSRPSLRERGEGRILRNHYNPDSSHIPVPGMPKMCLFFSTDRKHCILSKKMV